MISSMFSVPNFWEQIFHQTFFLFVKYFVVCLIGRGNLSFSPGCNKIFNKFSIAFWAFVRKYGVEVTPLFRYIVRCFNLLWKATFGSFLLMELAVIEIYGITFYSSYILGYLGTVSWTKVCCLRKGIANPCLLS